MVSGAAKWSELCEAKTPMMQRKGDKSQGAIAFTNTHRDDTYMLSKISQRQHMYNFTHYITHNTHVLLKTCRDNTFSLLQPHKDSTYMVLKTHRDNTFSMIQTHKDSTYMLLKHTETAHSSCYKHTNKHTY